MKIIILFLTSILIPFYLSASNISAKYKITYGGFLNLGEAISTLIIKDNKYDIKIEAKTTGMAKYLTNNRVEIYESQGKYIDNKFIPEKFIKTKKDNQKQRIRTYTFDINNKKILVEDIHKGVKYKIQNDFSKKAIAFSEHNNSTLDYYAKDDILSLFLICKSLCITLKMGKSMF